MSDDNGVEFLRKYRHSMAYMGTALSTRYNKQDGQQLTLYDIEIPGRAWPSIRLIGRKRNTLILNLILAQKYKDEDM